MSAPASVKRLKAQGDSTWLRIVLSEGKNREIRRMLARLEHKVMRLQRIAIGPVELGRCRPARPALSAPSWLRCAEAQRRTGRTKDKETGRHGATRQAKDDHADDPSDLEINAPSPCPCSVAMSFSSTAGRDRERPARTQYLPHPPARSGPGPPHSSRPIRHASPARHAPIRCWAGRSRCTTRVLDDAGNRRRSTSSIWSSAR